ncbi:MAG: tetratricopeptide repeat protein [Sandaracinaceae bacterium]
MPLDRQNLRQSRAIPVLLALLVVTAGVCGAGVGPSTAAAQEETSAEDTALARSLFQQGMEAIDNGDYETGADRLGRSLQVRDSVVVRANYALALIELGRLVEASEHLRTVQRATEPGSDAHQLAAVQLGRVQPMLGSVQIDVAGASEGVEVQIDGRSVPAAALGVPQPADPGERVITLHRAEQELLRQVVTVTREQTRTVSLTAPPPSAAELAEAEAARTQIVERERIIVREGGGVEEEAWFWVLITGLAAGAVAAVVTAIVVTNQGGGEFEEGSSRNTFLTLVEVP